MKKGTKLYSILHNKCPKCQEANVFESSNPYNLRIFATMHKSCPNCGMDFQQEPGFYFGATYVSYALQVVMVLVIYALLYLVMEWGIWSFVTACGVVLIGMLPLTFRTSRLIWLTMFGEKGREKKKN
jgi:uncharacterized protein (DUF983 family)